MRFAGYMRAAVTRFGVKCPAKDDRAKADAMMTKDEARRAVEVELQWRKLTKPMTLDQLNVFCERCTNGCNSNPKANDWLTF
jgi:hypothetical protein